MNKIKRFNLWELAKIILALGLLAVVISRVKLNDLLDLFTNVPLAWLIASFIVYFLMGMAKALQYYVLMDGRIHYFRMLYIVIINNTISNFIANSAGVASYLATLKLEDGINFTRAAVVFVITKITDVFLIALFLSMSSALIWAKIRDLRVFIVILLLGISLMVLLFIATILFRKSFVRFVETVLKVFRLMNLSLFRRGLESLKALAEQEQGLIFQTVLRALGLSLLYFILVLAMSIITYRLFSISFGIGVIVFITCLLQLLSLVPIGVFGGLGVNEISLAYIYNFFDLPQGEIPAIVLGIRILSYVLGVSGLWYLPAFRYYGKYQNRIT